jgi:asparagine synthase (glutamine-hydrolysing)
MCGIAAIVAAEREIPEGAIERMAARLTHRGPDARACVRLSGCHFGHTRLSIIDLATGDQPMSDATRRYWIVFNGEIYNYRELRAELERRGRTFRTTSDTEVLLAAWLEYGEPAVSRLNGQFAFLIWDTQERRLFGARDRMGEKPLYWAQSPQGHFLFASELKGLLAADLVEPRIDRVSVDAYLGLLYVPPDRTIYSNVHTLRPGHVLRWEEGRLEQRAYWQPAYSQPRVEDGPAVVEELRRLISQAVRRQMVADVPVGAFLSGGLDSSTVVALMTRHTSHPVATFSVGFGDLIDELPYARAVAEAYHTRHHEIQMDIPVGDMLDRMATVYDEPFADSSNIPTYLISEFARRHVKVALAGDGADELFGGYDWYRLLFDGEEGRPAWLERLNVFRWRLLRRLGQAGEAEVGRAVLPSQRRLLVQQYPELWRRHLAGSTLMDLDRAALWPAGRSPDAEESLRRTFEPGTEVAGLDRATDFDVRCYLPGDILVKVDRAAMAHSLESRAPFLDADLVEFTLKLPARLRFKGNQLKALLRESSAELWPEALRNRPKQGFGAPIRSWLQRPDVREKLARVCAARHPLATLLPGVTTLSPRHPQRSWTVLCLGLWLENHAACLSHLS